jgi:hypothetical protein
MNSKMKGLILGFTISFFVLFFYFNNMLSDAQKRGASVEKHMSSGEILTIVFLSFPGAIIGYLVGNSSNKKK